MSRIRFPIGKRSMTSVLLNAFKTGGSLKKERILLKRWTAESKISARETSRNATVLNANRRRPKQILEETRKRKYEFLKNKLYDHVLDLSVDGEKTLKLDHRRILHR